jgi:metal-responsive CopG/Arc/MetJ family transcriptional regulator
MTPAKPERTERLDVILPLDELAAIDEFRYRAQMPSRAAAVRELLRRGLASAEKER